MKHFYQCEYLNNGYKTETPFEAIFGDNISEQFKVKTQFFINYERREKHKSEKKIEEELQPHAIVLYDPLSSLSMVMENK